MSKKSLIKDKTFRIQPYNAPVRVVMAKDLSEAAKRFKGGKVPEYADAVVFDCTLKYVMIFQPNTSLQVIVHECGHVIGYIMRDFGIGFDANNSEPFCYLLNHLFDETLATLRKMGAKIKDI